MILIKTKKEGKKHVYYRTDKNDILFDSKGEVYISFWLDELKDDGYIKEWTSQPSPFILTKKITRDIEKQLKTKTKIIKESVMQGMIYTADFEIIWTEKAINSNLLCDFYEKNKKIKNQLFSFNNKSYIEAKPDQINLKKTFDPNGMVRSVRSKIKQVFDKHNIVVELVFHNNLFFNTFTPTRYLMKDKITGTRTIGYETRTLKEFIELIKPTKTITNSELF